MNDTLGSAHAILNNIERGRFSVAAVDLDQLVRAVLRSSLTPYPDTLRVVGERATDQQAIALAEKWSEVVAPNAEHLTAAYRALRALRNDAKQDGHESPHATCRLFLEFLPLLAVEINDTAFQTLSHGVDRCIRGGTEPQQTTSPPVLPGLASSEPSGPAAVTDPEVARWQRQQAKQIIDRLDSGWNEMRLEMYPKAMQSLHDALHAQFRLSCDPRELSGRERYIELRDRNFKDRGRPRLLGILEEWCRQWRIWFDKVTGSQLQHPTLSWNMFHLAFVELSRIACESIDSLGIEPPRFLKNPVVPRAITLPVSAEMLHALRRGEPLISASWWSAAKTSLLTDAVNGRTALLERWHRVVNLPDLEARFAAGAYAAVDACTSPLSDVCGACGTKIAAGCMVQVAPEHILLIVQYLCSPGMLSVEAIKSVSEALLNLEQPPLFLTSPEVEGLRAACSTQCLQLLYGPNTARLAATITPVGSEHLQWPEWTTFRTQSERLFELSQAGDEAAGKQLRHWEDTALRIVRDGHNLPWKSRYFAALQVGYFADVRSGLRDVSPQIYEAKHVGKCKRKASS